MVALTSEIRKEGRKAMEASLTKAMKVRRRMTSGPKLKTSRNYTGVEAVLQIIQGLQRAEKLMAEYKLEPADIRGSLIYTTPGGAARLIDMTPDPKDFFAQVEKVGQAPFFGILWQLADHEANNVKPWIQPFMVGPDAEKAFGEIIGVGLRITHA
jgi:hypothetical protein